MHKNASKGVARQPLSSKTSTVLTKNMSVSRKAAMLLSSYNKDSGISEVDGL